MTIAAGAAAASCTMRGETYVPATTAARRRAEQSAEAPRAPGRQAYPPSTTSIAGNASRPSCSPRRVITVTVSQGDG